MDTKPELPSERLLFALHALIEVENNPNRYGIPVVPNMGTYGFYYPELNQCLACLAGVAAIKRYSIPISALENGMTNLSFGTGYKAERELDDFWEYENSIDQMRRGRIFSAFVNMGLKGTDGEKYSRAIPPYEDDPIGFKSALFELVSDLKKDNL